MHGPQGVPRGKPYPGPGAVVEVEMGQGSPRGKLHWDYLGRLVGVVGGVGSVLGYSWGASYTRTRAEARMGLSCKDSWR